MPYRRWAAFFYIKNLSWFIAPNGCLAAKHFIVLPLFFYRVFMNIVLPSLHAVAPLFWY
jgi:hypothetical protein